MPRRVLFLISDTGGGHRASADAVIEGLVHLHGDDVQCWVVDLFAEHSPWPLHQIPKLYLPLINRYLFLWKLLWWLGEHPALWRAAASTMLAWNSDRLRRVFEHYPADLVVSTHPLLCQVPLQALRRFRPGTPFATVVTDLATAYHTWYDPNVDLLTASCPEVRQAALRAGVPAPRVRLLGLPISLAFRPPSVSQADLRHKLGLLDRPTVLLLGGGEGMGPVEDIAGALTGALTSLPAQLVIICGRNEELRLRLSRRSWTLPVHVHGFVRNMPAWMQAADCMVTKAGPGTIAEAMASGLPMVLSGYVPGQESGNVAYVVDRGIGVFVQDSWGIARMVHRWLEPGNPDLQAMRLRARELACPRAAVDIASALSELL